MYGNFWFPNFGTKRCALRQNSSKGYDQFASLEIYTQCLQMHLLGFAWKCRLS
jgi:hypothetical protein